MLSDCKEIKLKLTNKRNYIKYSNTQGLENILLNDQWVTEEIRGEIQKFLESNENENIRTYVYSKGSAKGEHF
jgi:hypothetical protein